MKKIYCTLDTETLNGITNPKCAYHIAGIIHDRAGNYIATFNYIVENMFQHISADSYAKQSFHRYGEMIAAGEVVFMPTVDDAVAAIEALFSLHHVTTVMAFNAAFDLCRGAASPLVENRDFVDIWAMALETICQQKKYRRFCEAHNLKSSSRKTFSTNAQTVYAFITDNPAYVEEHTAFEDSKIELEIFLACVRTHKRFTRGVYCGDLPRRFQLFPRVPKERA